MKKTSLFLVVALAAMVSLNAQTVPDGLLYANEGSGVKITGYTGTATTLVIPSSIGGRSVTIIGDRAFLSNVTVQNVTLPNTITTIEEAAFAGSVLRTINMPTALTTIGQSAFELCNMLRVNITFPASLRTIGDMAFYGTGLTGVTFNNGLLTIGEQAFRRSGIERVTLSRSTQVGENAFLGATITYR
jgi:hypothetical protein